MDLNSSPVPEDESRLPDLNSSPVPEDESRLPDLNSSPVPEDESRLLDLNSSPVPEDESRLPDLNSSPVPEDEKNPGNMCPPIPGRKRYSEFDLNVEPVPDDDDDGALAVPSNNNQEIDATLTNDDVLGDGIPDDQLNELRQICYQMLNMPMIDKEPLFPGSHPVSFSREKLQLLSEKYYYATWKACGKRYMMLVTMHGCYLIDRSFNFRRVQMRFPRTIRSDALHEVTLLDGEMIIDVVPENQQQVRRYLIYDIMAINNVSVVERPFSERFEIIEKEVIEPRNYERSRNRNSSYDYSLEPFSVRRKNFWLLNAVGRLLTDTIPRLSHEADGLIFKGWDDPYVVKTNHRLLKWKFPNMTVDFLFEIGPNGRESLYLNICGSKCLLEKNSVVFRDGSDSSSYSGKIIKCLYCADKIWKFTRVRVDKSTPDEQSTFWEMMRSSKENITGDDVLEKIKEIICLPMYVARTNADGNADQQRR